MTAWENANLTLLLHAAQMVALVMLWLRKPGEDAGKKADAVSGRVSLLEERLKHMPTSDELTELEGTVRAMDAKLNSLQEHQEQMRRTLARIEDYLLNHRS